MNKNTQNKNKKKGGKKKKEEEDENEGQTGTRRLETCVDLQPRSFCHTMVPLQGKAHWDKDQTATQQWRGPEAVAAWDPLCARARQLGETSLCDKLQ